MPDLVCSTVILTDYVQGAPTPSNAMSMVSFSGTGVALPEEATSATASVASANFTENDMGSKRWLVDSGSWLS